MKISGDPMQFAQNPPVKGGLCGVLIYGPNAALADTVADTLRRVLLPQNADDFANVVLDGDTLKADAGPFVDEMMTSGFFAAQKVVTVKNASDSMTRTVQDVLDMPHAGHFFILQADALTPKSSLRALAEKSDRVAALACYELDGVALNRFIIDRFRDRGASITSDGAALIANRLGGDMSVLNTLADQLVLYAGGDKPTISPSHVESLLVDQAEQALDDAVRAVADRDAAAFDRIVTTMAQSGESMIGPLRAMQYYFYKLRGAAADIASGADTESALAKIRPPLFFKTKPVFTRHLRTWSLPLLDRVLRELLYLESQCKKTGTPEAALVQQRLLPLLLKK